MLAADRKKRHNFCYSQKLRPFLRQLKRALAPKSRLKSHHRVTFSKLKGYRISPCRVSSSNH
jgi:hypothetical protein